MPQMRTPDWARLPDDARLRGLVIAAASALLVLAAVVIIDAVNADPAHGPSPLIVRAGAAPDGKGTGDRPFATIQAALRVARGGQTVQVGPGVYREQVRSVRSGRPRAPIRLTGHGARIVGRSGTNHLIEIGHNHIEVRGFTISHASTLISMTRVRGVRILGNTLRDGGGECVRLRYFSVRNEVAYNRIVRCGREGFDLGDNRKNGEGIYIGTAPEQLDRNPRAVPDRSNANRVHHNSIVVPAECVDIKEDAAANVVTDNRCVGSKDPQGAGFSSRGIATVFRRNDSSGHAGAGIRVGGDHHDDGVRTVITGNRLHDNGHTGLKVIRRPQGLICGNRFWRNRDGDVNVNDVRADRRCPAPARK